jgi:hypothetical protein
LWWFIQNYIRGVFFYEKIFGGDSFCFFSVIGWLRQSQQRVQDVSYEEETTTTVTVEQPTGNEFAIAVMDIVNGPLSSSLANKEMTRTENKLDVINSAGIMAVSDGYAYWNYSVATVNNGNVVEVYQGQYRYYDKTTGLPFTKAEKNFTQEDLTKIDYIERYLSVKGFYDQDPYDPTKYVYKIDYHEKITPQGSKYLITLYSDGYSVMDYIGWPVSKLNISTREILYDPKGKSGTGTMTVVAASPYQAFNFTFEGGVQNDKIKGKCHVYNQTNIMADFELGASSGYVETAYYVGKNYYYSSLSNINSGIEDNALIEFQDSQRYSETVTIDGSGNYSATTPERLQNLKLTSKSGLSSYPELTSLVTIKKVDGLTINNITFKKKGIRVVNCTKVTINGSYYDSVTDRVFKN